MTDKYQPNPLLNSNEAAAFLGVSAAFLQRDRLRDAPQVPFIKMAHRIVRYRISDLEKYIADHMKG